MKKNILNLYENFLDDLDKLNKDKENKEFGDVNSGVYDEHDFIINQYGNNKILFNCLDKYFNDHNLQHHQRSFTQSDLDQITYLEADYEGCSYFEDKNLISFNELKYFRNLKIIKNNTFNNSVFNEIEFPSKLEEIWPDAFYDNYRIREIILPKSIKILYRNSFGYHWKLGSYINEIYIPDTIKNIADGAFNGILKDALYCNVTIPKIFKNRMYNIFTNCGDFYKNNNITINYI